MLWPLNQYLGASKWWHSQVSFIMLWPLNQYLGASKWWHSQVSFTILWPLSRYHGASKRTLSCQLYNFMTSQPISLGIKMVAFSGYPYNFMTSQPISWQGVSNWLHSRVSFTILWPLNRYHGASKWALSSVLQFYDLFTECIYIWIGYPITFKRNNCSKTFINNRFVLESIINIKIVALKWAFT